MKKILNLVCMATLAGIVGTACDSLGPVDRGDWTSTDYGFGQISDRVKYYWSGGEKIWLDVDRSLVIAGFDSEGLAKAFVESIPAGVASLFDETTVWVDVSDEDMVQRVLADKTATNKIYGHKFSGYGGAFRMNGKILLQPKAGVSSREIVSRFKVDAKSVEDTDICVVIMLNDWGKILSTANAIYESGMVDWCHPDFWSPIDSDILFN